MAAVDNSRYGVPVLWSRDNPGRIDVVRRGTGVLVDDSELVGTTGEIGIAAGPAHPHRCAAAGKRGVEAVVAVAPEIDRVIGALETIEAGGPDDLVGEPQRHDDAEAVPGGGLAPGGAVEGAQVEV